MENDPFIASLFSTPQSSQAFRGFLPFYHVASNTWVHNYGCVTDLQKKKILLLQFKSILDPLLLSLFLVYIISPLLDTHSYISCCFPWPHPSQLFGFLFFVCWICFIDFGLYKRRRKTLFEMYNPPAHKAFFEPRFSLIRRDVFLLSYIHTQNS
jgi:hypothetical protein